MNVIESFGEIIHASRLHDDCSSFLQVFHPCDNALNLIDCNQCCDTNSTEGNDRCWNQYLQDSQTTWLQLFTLGLFGGMSSDQAQRHYNDCTWMVAWNRTYCLGYCDGKHNNPAPEPGQ